MKIHRLSMVIFLSLYSCIAAPIQNISPSSLSSNLQPTSTATSQPENRSSPNIQITSSPNATISHNPSIILTDDNNIRNISSITMIADDNTVIGKETFKTDFSIPNSYNLYSYNILPNEQKKFDAYFVENSEIKRSDIGWSSNNIDIATVDNNGLVSSTNKKSTEELIGSTIIKAYVKSNPQIAVSFTVNLYNKLDIIIKNKNYNSCQETQRKVTLPRYQLINGGRITPSEGGYLAEITGPVRIYGKIYNTDIEVLDGVTVTARTVSEIENSNTENWKGETQITKTAGEYLFIGVPTCEEILITVSKEGFVSKSRKIIPNLLDKNQVNFGGRDSKDAVYALEKIQN